MPRREKSPVGARTRHPIIPREQSTDSRVMAKRPILDRGDSAPLDKKAANPKKKKTSKP